MKDNKTIYFIIAIVAIVFLLTRMTGNETGVYAEVLPSADYCIDEGKDVSYKTMQMQTGNVPVEYCKLQDFCSAYEVSTVLEGQEFDEEVLAAFTETWNEYDCFVDEALNTQRDYEGDNPANTKVKSKFVCCNAPSTGGMCEENTCGGSFTGVTDDYGCKLYGIEYCKAQTDCKLVGGERLCDPEPFVNGCTWETKNEYGDTYFTEFNNCGLEVIEPCGSIVSYRCVKDSSELCDLVYDLKTGEYVEGCGGFKAT